VRRGALATLGAVGLDPLLADLFRNLALLGEGVLLEAYALLGNGLLLDHGNLLVEDDLVFLL
jgi:hypothetical protein